MQVVGAGLDKDDCNSFPSFSVYDLPYLWEVLNCTNPIKSYLYFDATCCISKSNISSLPTFYSYFLNGYTIASDFHQFCIAEAEVPI
ncbi:LEAF RUST 10 DISEASE-RESISTANCE LOCUS RECEPTOR-LIKE PROTEIN KINASE-like 2.2 [Gossypium australe]|uniref:LEAF RUST 10 DISEASE-RESISTANCE LOCUS RECEPTOR-LIKE PROTEIN KINASE-like 2.2 n=1 Tax=Gossypium australe TaxID=47621 RepID=A0A5B6VFH3_9ROSI|nr:LEAF RUST 10 DISEASE-RESISTANCE LOCUS RECEPTOR-LIKE PROTEIN KINASE-like 2.2 [Gossypium australe]